MKEHKTMKKCKSRGTRSEDKARDIIEHNIYVIYHLPKRYKCVHYALETSEKRQPLRDLLLKILNFSKGTVPVIWNQRYVNHIDNNRVTYIFRHNQSTGTANRYFNFLCCMGLLKKQKQTPENMTRINEEFLKETNKPRPINVISVPRYSKEYLQQVEARTQQLMEHQVTRGNIGRNKLMAAGLNQLADEVYPLNDRKSFPNKQELYKRLEQVIDKAIKEQGYVYLAQVAAALDIPEKDVKAIKKIFAGAFNEKYHYGATTAIQAEQYNIPTKKWIITRRATNDKA